MADRPPTWVLTVCALATLVVADPAAANIFERFGFGAQGAAMVNANVSLDGGYGAAFNNPGALTGAKNVILGTGLSWLKPALSLESAFGPVPQTRPASDNVGLHLGAVFPLFGVLDRVALGAAVFVPTATDTRVETIDFRLPHFYRYHALPDRIVGAVSVGVRLHEMVSVGVGAQVLGRLDGGAVFGVDLPAQRITSKTLEAELAGDARIIAGAMFRPTPRLRIGFAYHEAVMLEFRQFIDATIEGLGRLLLDISGSSLYSPHRCTLGASFAITPSLSLAADVEWALWSLAPDPSLQFELLLDVGALGIDPRRYGSAQVALGAVDTLAPKVGVEWRLNPRYTLRAGYAYTPTPLPAQTGTTNIIDADAHQLGVGVAVHFRNPVARDQAPLAVELGTQVTLLSDRTMTKSAVDDPVGDYTATGSIWHTSVTLSHHFSSP